ncbi:MAG: DUF1501 domain-containing protein, partial [Pseudomonadota bacterium]
DLLAINPITSDGVDYGLHPMMGGVQSMFESQQAAFVANVGPLIEPTSKADFFSGSVALPPQLFSHNDQQDQWHSLRGQAPLQSGWAGRLADVLAPQVETQQLSTNSSLFGTSLFLVGQDTTAYVMGPGGPLTFAGVDSSEFGLQQRQAFEQILGANYASIYARAFAEVQDRAIDTADLVNDALTGAPVLSTPFPSTQLGTQLNTVARLIAVRDQLQMERQVFFVATGGFDTHDDQVALQPGLLGGVSDAIKAFYDATVELTVQGQVTTFTQSDFGRTLTSNGDGTDHAWGSVQLVTGGSVVGREIYGSYPLLLINGPDDVGGGRMIPTTSADQVAATLAAWMGAEPGSIADIAPNIGNFAAQDLGFLV